MTFNMPITIHGEDRTETVEVEDLAMIEVALNQDGDMSAIRCKHCGQELNEADPSETLEDGDRECPATSNEQHEQEYAPLTWAKNIAVSFDEERDTIDLTIATGEPRGGWQFRLRRTDKGVVLMHLPHEDMIGPHEPLKEIHPGTFAIG